MKYHVSKFVKPRREDHDNTLVNSADKDSLEIFRTSRLADPLGQAVTEMLNPEENTMKTTAPQPDTATEMERKNDDICPNCGSTILLGRMKHHQTWCHHTRLPWRLHPTQNPPVIYGDGCEVAYVRTSSPDSGEQEANARLIVRAVNSHAELLAALTSIIDHGEHHFTDNNGWKPTLCVAQYERAIAALTKAEASAK